MLPRRLCLPSLFALIFGLLAAAPSYAQNQGALHPWNTLSPAQQNMLQPLQSQWDTLPPKRQEHMLERTQGWLKLPPERQQEIRDRIARWQQMTPAQREQARQNQHLYDTLSPDKQQQLHDAFKRFQQLPPDQREALRRQWQQQSPDQKRQWLQHVGPRSTLPGKHAFGMPGR
ncbi:DUF3106 domain-containing protein [Dyella mobilis]|uniref:DUF3106 domain-containing protein n=1 Tax=Dyella mobilis TaxID=1849582 RepID=A0ABS2KHL7_9GAMM|nr:DUF3106 domain-containing protein [Dyella mobilis]MBM7130423.1 DUF3106 domain-containing protein [Dyella mobilis]GLQ97050.1 hypothetical protein GCM10007863_14700 [Dyella mobilis]